jgi:hypothetical protein
VFSWPPPIPTSQQIAEVRACRVVDTAETRYPPRTDIDFAAAPHTNACDEAVLAHACAVRLERHDSPSAACVAAYRAAVSANPAYAFAGGIPYAYGEATAVSASPGFGPVASVKVDYSWSGLGTPVEWSYTLTDIPNGAKVEVTGAPHGAPPPALADAARALADQLGDFLPIARPVDLAICYDNYPKWHATVTFVSGRTITLDTHGANLLPVGGPWFLEEDGHLWMQVSADLVRGIAGIADALGLPFGSPEAMTCKGLDLFDGVYGPASP